MKAVGAGGVVDPMLAAWLPNMVFLLAGLVLLAGEDVRDGRDVDGIERSEDLRWLGILARSLAALVVITSFLFRLPHYIPP